MKASLHRTLIGRVSQWLWILSASTLGALILFGLLAWIALHFEVPTQRVIPHLPGVQVVGAKGGLLHEFSAEQITIELPRQSYVRLKQVKLNGLTVFLDPAAEWFFGLAADELSAGNVDIVWNPNPKPTPSVAPRDLRLPLSIDVARVRVGVGTSALWGEAPLRELDGRVQLLQRKHEITLKSLSYERWSGRGHGVMQTMGKLQLDAQLVAVGQYQNAESTHALEANVVASGSLRELNLAANLSAKTEAGTQSMTAHSKLTLWEAWPLRALTVNARDFDLASANVKWPKTRVTGKAAFSAVKGQMQSEVALTNAMPGPWSHGRIPVRSLRGTTRFGFDGTQSDWLAKFVDGVVDVDARMFGPEGARAELKGQWGRRDGEAAGRENQITVSLWSTSLRELDQRAPGLTLSGQVAAQALGESGEAKRWDERKWRIHADLSGTYQKAKAQVVAELPVAASLAAVWQRGDVALSNLSLSSGPARAEAEGDVAYGAELNFWQTRLRMQFTAFDPKVWLPWPEKWLGENSLQGAVDVDLASNWKTRARIQLKDSKLTGVRVAGDVAWDAPREVMSWQTDLDVGGNRLIADGKLPWRVGADGRPHLAGSQAWQAQLDGRHLEALGPMLEAFGVSGIQGHVQARASYAGESRRFQTLGQFEASHVKFLLGQQRTPYSVSESIGSWDIATTQPSSTTRVDIKLANLLAAQVKLDAAALRGSGHAAQHAVELVASGGLLPKAGQSGGDRMPTVQLDARMTGGVAGSLGNMLGWHGTFEALRITQPDSSHRTWLNAQPFAVVWQPLPDGYQWGIKQANLDVLSVPMRLTDFSWASQSKGEGGLSGALNIPAFSLAKLLRQWQPQTGWGGDLMLAGRVHVEHSSSNPWQVKASVEKVSGDLTLSDETIEGNATQFLGIDRSKLELNASHGLWVFTQHFEGQVLGKLLGRQSVQASSPTGLPIATDPISGAWDIHVENLRPWAAWVPPGWRLNGRVTAHAELAGTLGSPQYQGSVLGQSLQLSNALMGVNLTDGRMTLALQGAKATLDEFVASGGHQGGIVRARGHAVLDGVPQMEVQIEADRFALLQRIDRRLLVSGQATAAMGESDIDVKGKFRVDEGLFDLSRSDAPTIGEDVNVLNGPGSKVGEEDSEGNGRGSQRKVQASVEIALGDNLHLKGRGLDTDLTGAVKFTTPNNRPTLNGTIRTVNGTYAAYGQKLQIERGAIAFTGLIENPRLDILAIRAQSPMSSAAFSDSQSSDVSAIRSTSSVAEGTVVKVGVAIAGTAQNPRVTLYSEPAMSETEKLSWLVLGRAPSGLGGADIGLLQSAAVALLSGEGPSTTDNIMGRLGLDELSVRQSDGTVRETVVNVGKQLSRRWYVGYERNINATSGNWQLIYRLAQRFTLRAQTGIDNAVDLIWSWRWD